MFVEGLELTLIGMSGVFFISAAVNCINVCAGGDFSISGHIGRNRKNNRRGRSSGCGGNRGQTEKRLNGKVNGNG